MTSRRSSEGLRDLPSREEDMAVEVFRGVGAVSEVVTWLLMNGQIFAETDLVVGETASRFVYWAMICGGVVHGSFVVDALAKLPEGFMVNRSLVLSALIQSVKAGKAIQLQTNAFRTRQEVVGGVPTQTLHPVVEVILQTCGGGGEALVVFARCGIEGCGRQLAAEQVCNSHDSEAETVGQRERDVLS
ncbi:hypothetical protein MIND_00406800 [Mycena indigotica]|uniref:Uncharacterized protein n=1 Tax=Mycena indigotica TaxID=2126181 RepID=A0A8H6T4P0_9AGAR|nr:uncharacterized protein MIND_00406800 [Mycena indigotica]KAF7310327.1 hypothetical protein MIND_00406800 [Mycena indigotica]